MGSEEIKQPDELEQLAATDVGLSVALESAAPEHASTLREKQQAVWKRMSLLQRRPFRRSTKP